MQAQRIAIIGSGAIGGVLAAAAHASGHQVSLCVRTPFEKLTVEAPEHTERVPVEIHTDPSTAGAADWVLVTTKVQDVPSTFPWLRRFDSERTPVVLVQNGVEHADTVAANDPHAPLLPALIYVGAERVSPGHVVRRTATTVSVPEGELGGRFTTLFDHESTTVRQTSDFRTAAWRKMLMNVAANPITALTLRRLDIFDDPDVQQLSQGVLAETIAVAEAEGAQLAQADADRVLATYTGVPDNGTSMLYDRLAGASTEHEHISGAVVRAGQRHGIATPLNHALLTMMRLLRVD